MVKGMYPVMVPIVLPRKEKGYCIMFLRQVLFRVCITYLSTYDFSTFYTTLPHN